MNRISLPTIDLSQSQIDQSDLVDFVKENLDSYGCVLLKEYPVDINCLQSTSKKYQDFCELIGQPVSHDENNSIVWDIKKAAQSESAVQTYSEHDGEAELHTDSQYREKPEDYFGLLSLVRANCGGGMSLIMRRGDVIQELSEKPNGKELVAALKTEQFPFVVPTVFKRTINEEPEFVYGPILTEDKIRFRVDTMIKALPYHDNLLSDTALKAFNALVEIVRESPRIQRFFLEPRDLIFINNTTVLHGRTAFSDHARHMLRIRMNKR